MARVAYVAGLMCALITGCGVLAPGEPSVMKPPDPVLGMLDIGIAQLTTNIDGLSKRMGELERLADHNDPMLRQLRALDLAGWKLHQQSWMLQREHLQFAKAHILLAKEKPVEKSRALEEWLRHEQDFEQALADLREQRLQVEKHRLSAEARLIEQSLR